MLTALLALLTLAGWGRVGSVLSDSQGSPSSDDRVESESGRGFLALVIGGSGDWRLLRRPFTRDERSGDWRFLRRLSVFTTVRGSGDWRFLRRPSIVRGSGDWRFLRWPVDTSEKYLSQSATVPCAVEPTTSWRLLNEEPLPESSTSSLSTSSLGNKIGGKMWQILRFYKYHENLYPETKFCVQNIPACWAITLLLF